MAGEAQARLKEWLATGKARLEPLSFPQREIWETSAAPPDDPSHLICCYLDIRGPLTRPMCEEALGHVIVRQDALRTTILPGKTRPLQLVRTRATPVMGYRELAPHGAEGETLLEEMQETFTRPIDLVRGPLYRLDMLKRGPDHHALALAIHHAVADGWSVNNFVHDFVTGCLIAWGNAGNDLTRAGPHRLDLPPLTMTCPQWASAERARWTPEEISRHTAYWRERLAGSCLLFADRAPSGGGTSHRVERWNTDIPPALADRVRALAKATGATLFGTLLAAFRLALHRWAGADDTVIGTPVAGRARTGVRETMGYFSNIVPLRARIDPSRTLLEVTREVHAQTVEDLAREMPFAELVHALANDAPRGRHPVFDVRFAVQNHPFPGVDIPGISSHLQRVSSGTSRFDMACEISEAGRKLEMIWLHRPGVLDASEVRDLDRLFRAVLEEA